MNKFFITEEDVGRRLDSFISLNYPDLSRSHIKRQIENGEITISGKTVKAGEKLKMGMVIEVAETQPEPLKVEAENIPLNIVYEDGDLAVINKPKGMVVHPANGNTNGTLVNALLYNLKNLSGINGIIRPGIVHRLDKDTSGLLLVAKNDKAHINLAKQIETKACHRYYLAIVSGNVRADAGTISTGFGRSLKDRKQMATFPQGSGKHAITNYKVLERFGKYTLMEFKLETGRTHQIRVHSKYIGHPILCDEVYGYKDKNINANGQLLHAYKIEFTHPTTGEEMTFTCEPPEDFNKILKKLRT